MPDPTTLYAFALTSVRIEITPGPNMAYLALLAASKGAVALPTVRKSGRACLAGAAVAPAVAGRRGPN